MLLRRRQCAILPCSSDRLIALLYGVSLSGVSFLRGIHGPIVSCILLRLIARSHRLPCRVAGSRILSRRCRRPVVPCRRSSTVEGRGIVARGRALPHGGVIVMNCGAFACHIGLAAECALRRNMRRGPLRGKVRRGPLRREVRCGPLCGKMRRGCGAGCEAPPAATDMGGGMSGRVSAATVAVARVGVGGERYECKSSQHCDGRSDLFRCGMRHVRVPIRVRARHQMSLPQRPPPAFVAAATAIARFCERR
ncbi:MAG: hypothetical protein OJF62_002185 [Pseudolabrys sp.]|nr:hypothetical protein [Pseudolabrys sp.]